MGWLFAVGFVRGMRPMDMTEIPTPCYVCDLDRLAGNLQTLEALQKDSGAAVLLALKAFSMFSVFEPLRQVLAGTTASSLHEARLGFEEFKRPVHVYCPAYDEEEFGQLASYASHLVFNSLSQLERFRPLVGGLARPPRMGLRINPECSLVEHAVYDPCVAHSRLGVRASELRDASFEGVTGLHFHSLCGAQFPKLEQTLEAVESSFGPWLRRVEWVNFGGGHALTDPAYDRKGLCRLIRRLKETYGVEVFLEPGEAVVLNAGVLVARVLDIVDNGLKIAILNTSASAHMPDVLEMPYRPEVVGAQAADVLPHTYRLGGVTCLAGDIIGDYSFSEPLRVGSRVVFEDMLPYTMVKNTLFNGVRLPSIGTWSKASGFRLVRTFGYEDYKGRLS